MQENTALVEDTAEATEPVAAQKPTVRIPLPPQLKLDEDRRREAERATEAVAISRPSVATAPNPPRTVDVVSDAVAKPAPIVACPSCTKTITPENARFSFCVHCGADLPRPESARPEPRTEYPTVPPVQRTPFPTLGSAQEPFPNGVRDPRNTMRKIAQVHGGASGGGQAQMQLPLPQQTMAATTEGETKREVNSTVNAICSFFLPGVGQMLNGQVGKGMLLLVGLFIAVSILGWQYFGLPLLIAQTLSAIDAYRIGERRRSGEKVNDGEWDVA